MIYCRTIGWCGRIGCRTVSPDDRVFGRRNRLLSEMPRRLAGQVANLVLTLLSKHRTVPWPIQIQLPLTILRQGSRSFEMAGVNGTPSTIDNTTGFLTARIRADLSLRLRRLTVSSVCLADMRGTG